MNNQPGKNNNYQSEQINQTSFQSFLQFSNGSRLAEYHLIQLLEELSDIYHPSKNHELLSNLTKPLRFTIILATNSQSKAYLCFMLENLLTTFPYSNRNLSEFIPPELQNELTETWLPSTINNNLTTDSYNELMTKTIQIFNKYRTLINLPELHLPVPTPKTFNKFKQTIILPPNFPIKT